MGGVILRKLCPQVPVPQRPAMAPRRAFESLELALLSSKRLACRIKYSGGDTARVVAPRRLVGGTWAVVDVTVSHGSITMRVDGVPQASERLWTQSEVPPAAHIGGAFMLGAAAARVVARVVIADAWVQRHAWGEPPAGSPPRLPAPPAELGASIIDEVMAAYPDREPRAVLRALAALCDGAEVSAAVARDAARGSAGDSGGGRDGGDGRSLVRAAVDIGCDGRVARETRSAALRAARRVLLLAPAAAPQAGATASPPDDSDARELVARLWGLVAGGPAARCCYAAAATTAWPPRASLSEAAGFLLALIGADVPGAASRAALATLHRAVLALPAAAAAAAAAAATAAAAAVTGDAVETMTTDAPAAVDVRDQAAARLIFWVC
jgi:hypothetical protein